MLEDLSFGELILIHRVRMDLSQRELAEKIGVTPITISNYENGVSFPVKYELLSKLGEVLNIPEENLLDFLSDYIETNSGRSTSISQKRNVSSGTVTFTDTIAESTLKEK